MSENAMNAVAMNRPVTAADIAAKLGLSYSTVSHALSNGSQRLSQKTRDLVRRTAQEMGYSAYAANANSAKRASHVASLINADVSAPLKRYAKEKGCSEVTAWRHFKKDPVLAEKYGYKSHAQRKEERAQLYAEKKASAYYRDTPFHTVQEQIAYMNHLRSQGYGNMEIAKRTGVHDVTVRRKIGTEPASLAKHNRSTAQTLRAQKNAARKAYVRNAPIAEYNKRVEEHNALKAKVAQMEQELRPQTSAIENLAAQTVVSPTLNLTMLQPTAIM